MIMRPKTLPSVLVRCSFLLEGSLLHSQVSCFEETSYCVEEAHVARSQGWPLAIGRALSSKPTRN